MAGVINMSAEEKEAVEELHWRMKSDLSSEMADDTTLFYRFLKARDFNVDRAEAMLRKHLEWRKENRIDYILKEYKPPEVIEKYFTPCFIGFDKEGCLVRYTPSGNIDEKGIDKSTTVKELIKSVVHLMEGDVNILKEQSQKLGRPVTQFVYIYDLENGSLAKVTNKRVIELMLGVIQLNQDNYPERLKAVFVINAPVFFPLLFSILKAFMASALLRKIHVFGTEGWKEALLEIIDPEVLPAFLGGQRTDPDGNPLCNTFVYHGSLVPEHYYAKPKESLSLLSDVKTLTVPSLSKIDVPLTVQECDSFIEWEFETKQGDIGFGLFLAGNSQEESSNKELLPIRRVNTTELSEKGLYKCESAGTYIFVFDNCYSWLRSKEVYYRVKVLNADNGKGEDETADS